MDSLKKGSNSAFGPAHRSSPGLVGVSRGSGEVSGVVLGVRKESFWGPNRVPKGSNRTLKVLQRPWFCKKLTITIAIKINVNINININISININIKATPDASDMDPQSIKMYFPIESTLHEDDVGFFSGSAAEAAGLRIRRPRGSGVWGGRGTVLSRSDTKENVCTRS